MARTLTHKDAYALINALVDELTGGQSTIQAVDPSSFVSVGETVLSYGTENVLNAIAMLAGKVMADAKPYKSQFVKLRAANSGIFTAIKGKIKYYAQPALTDGSTNTDLLINLAAGFDNGTNPTALGVDQSAPSQWEQHPAIVAQLWFAGSSTWQDCITKYENQLQIAFRSEEEFLSFWGGVMTEKANDIESQKEAFDRIAILNYLAGVLELSSDMAGSAVNLTSEFNTEYGTSYTTQQLLTTYLEEFSAFFAEKVKTISGFLEDRSVMYHWPIPKTIGATTYNVLEHCPKANQRMLLLESFWTKVEAHVKPQIFNTEYLDFGKFIPVKYWQNEQAPSAIKVTPAIPDTSDPTEQTAGNQVSQTYILGAIMDEDAVVTDYQLDDVSTTPKEARKHYRNTWFTFRRNMINDFSKKGVVFYMAD